MKKSAYFITTLVAIFLSSGAISADFNATGLWSYTELFPNDDGNCPFDYTLKAGQIVIGQSGDEFAIVSPEKVLPGTISQGTYTYRDLYYEHNGWFNVTANITFNSDRLGQGMAIWEWRDISDPLNPKVCSGLYNITIIKIGPQDPVYDATGIWKYSYSNFSNDCGFSNPIESGIYNITQNGNLITLVDNNSGDLLIPMVGYVDGASYYFVKVYNKPNGAKDGITGELFSLELSSSKDGSGDCEWIWINTNNTSDNCGGTWDVIIKSTADFIPSNPLLLLND